MARALFFPHPMATPCARDFPDSASLEAIARAFAAEDSDRLFVAIRRGACLAPVPLAWRARARVKPGAEAVLVRAPQGIDDPTAASVALLVLAAAAGPLGAAAAAGLGLTGFAAGVVGTSLALGLTLGGARLIAPNPPDADALAGAAPSPSLSGVGNRATPWRAVPRIFGRVRVYPPLGAPQVAMGLGDPEVRALFDLGPGRLDLTDMRLGETPIAEYGDAIETQTTDGAPGSSAQARLSLFPQKVSVATYDVPMVAGERVTRGTANADEVEVEIGFPSGILTHTRSVSSGAFGFAKRRKTFAGVLAVRVALLDPETGATAASAERVFASAEHAIDLGRRAERVGRGEARALRLRPAPRGPAQSWDAQVSWRVIGDIPDPMRINLLRVRAIQDGAPITSRAPHALVALRARATDDLRGFIDDFNCIAQAHLPVAQADGSIRYQATRHPAWAFLDVLIGAAARTPVPLDEIDLGALRAWAHADPDRAFDAVCDFRLSRREMLHRICAASRAAYAWRDGKHSVVRDSADGVPVQLFTGRNARDMSGVMTFARPPDALRARYVDEARAYEQQEVLVCREGLAGDPEVIEDIEMWGSVRRDQAARDARYHLEQIRLRPELFSWTTDMEGLVAQRGDVVRVVSAAARAGGEARRVSGREVGDNQVSAVTLDAPIIWTDASAHGVVARTGEGVSQARRVVAGLAGEETETLTFAEPVALSTAPDIGDLVVVGALAEETLDLVLVGVETRADFSARLTGAPRAAALATLDARAEPVPPYAPNVRKQTALRSPSVPSITASEIISVARSPEGLRFDAQLVCDVSPAPGAPAPLWLEAQVRRVGETLWRATPLTPAAGAQVRLAGLDLRGRYEARVRVRDAAMRVSGWSTLAPIAFAGADRPPGDVRGLAFARFGREITLRWDASEDLDVVAYEVRHTPTLAVPSSRLRLAQGAGLRLAQGGVLGLAVAVARAPSWSLAREVARAPSPSVRLPAATGTYFVKAVDIEGRLSVNAAAIAQEAVPTAEAQATLTQDAHPGWSGVLAGLVRAGAALRLTDAREGEEGVYTSEALDLGHICSCEARARVLFGVANLGFDLLKTADVLALTDIVDGKSESVGVEIERRVTRDDPTSDNPRWGAWAGLFAERLTFRAIQLRLRMITHAAGHSPVAEALTLEVDIPERLASGANAFAPAAGKRVAFAVPFLLPPVVAATLRDGRSGDSQEVAVDAGGFVVRVVDAQGVAVARHYDWLARGFGVVDAA